MGVEEEIEKSEKNLELLAENEDRLEDLKSLRNIISEIPEEGKEMDRKLRNKIMGEIEHFVRDFVEDDGINMKNLRKSMLKDYDLTPQEKTDIMKLKDLYDQVASNKHIDNDTFAKEMKSIMNDLKREIKQEIKEERKIAHMAPKDKKKEIIKKIEALKSRLPKKNGTLNDRQINLLLDDTKDIIGQIIGEKVVKAQKNWNVDVAQTLKPSALKDLDKEEKHWVKELQTIIQQLKDHNFKDIESELDHLEEEVEEEIYKSEKNLHDLAENEDRLEDLKSLRNIISEIPEEGHEMERKLRDKIMGEIEHFVRDFVEDDGLEMNGLKKSMLNDYNLTPQEKTDIMKLKTLWDEVKSNKHIDNDQFAKDMKSIMNDLKKEIKEEIKEERKIAHMGPKDKKKEIIKKIEALKKRLPKKNGTLNDRQINLLLDDTKDIIGQ